MPNLKQDWGINMKRMYKCHSIVGLFTAACMTVTSWAPESDLYANYYGDCCGNATAYNYDECTGSPAVIVKEKDCCADWGVYLAAGIIGALAGLAAGLCCRRRGREGEEGDPGPQGPSGPAGPSGPPGPGGPAGPAGAPGAAGAPGLNGQNGAPGAPGAAGVSGPAGPAGTAGADGLNGVNGLNGGTGAPGINGVNGANGTDGVNGVNGGTGAPGAAGPAGPAGSPGVAGAAGSTGASGPAGSAGATGAPGASGAAGAAGPAGVAGPAGPAGAPGAPGAAGASSSSSSAAASSFETPDTVVTLRFDSVMAQNTIGTWRGVVVTPDHQVITTSPIRVSPMGTQSETVTFTAPKSLVGGYQVIFMSEDQEGEGSTLGSVEISTADNSTVQHFAPHSLVRGAGEQVAFDFDLN